MITKYIKNYVNEEFYFGFCYVHLNNIENVR